jgi:Icc-related predicted phosphoesterase
MAQWFFTSDLHGQGDLYEQVFAGVAAASPRVLILGGDLGPHAHGGPGVARQRLWLEGFLVEFARRLRERVSGCTLALLMGNDDWAANLDVLERHHGDLWRHLHGRIEILDGIAVGGCSFVPITPFRLKDWERWEDGDPEHPARLEGERSTPQGLVEPFAFDPSQRTPTLASALQGLVPAAGAEALVCVTHSPPRDTACDRIEGGAAVGSRAIRAFLEQQQPRLCLSGHIHESPRVSGAWRDRIGRTVCVNPGQFRTPGVCGVWFDPAEPDTTLRHTVHA